MKSKLLIAWLAIFAPTVAYAHVSSATVGGLAAGFVHPFTGLDHMLAVIAVGLWAGAEERLGFRWVILPAIFVVLMVGGAIMAMAGVTLPLVETGIAVSVLVLGLLVAASLRLPLSSGMVVIGLFALFHGRAHGGELHMTASPLLPYGLGFVVATLLLHAIGCSASLLARRFSRGSLIRTVGGAIVVSGVVLILFP